MARKTQSYSNSEFQNKMLKIFVGISLIQGAFFAFASFGILKSVKNVAVQSGLPTGHAFFENFRSEETYIYLLVMSSILLATVGFVWVGLKVSQEAVGAIYRMKKDIEKMTTTKKLFKVKLRRNDYFKDFENSFNEMVTTLTPHVDFEIADEFTPIPESFVEKNPKV